MVGIYKITNNSNGKHYIGQSTNIALRRQDGCDVCNHDGFDEMVCYIPTENGDGLMVMSNYCPNCGCEISKQAIKYGAGYVDQDILRSAT